MVAKTVDKMDDEHSRQWQTLAQWRHMPMPVEDCLRIALGICKALIASHETETCFGQLALDTVLVCPSTCEVRLLAGGDTPLQGAAHIRVVPAPGLAFRPPEQSGRINRRLDARSDCYALGVILYWMLTGTLPFKAGDALEWLHAHAARVPEPPHTVTAAVPLPLSGVVMKMLEKSPDRRYQSMSGLQADLTQCAQQWYASRRIAPFVLGRYDIAGRFKTLHRLYGREQAVADMHAAYRRVSGSGRSELLLLSGPAGVGKSSLVEELEQHVHASNGIFIAGKFDQYKGQTSYATLCRALSELVQGLLGSDEASLLARQERLDRALGQNGALVIDAIAHARLLLGEQPAPPPLPPREAQQRFFATLRNFMTAFADRGRPLVIFLDDLQWTDGDTLAFLHFLLIESAPPDLLVVGAYRDNEVTPGHPLSLALERALEAGFPLSRIRLEPLSEADFITMLGDILDMPPELAAPLAVLVHRKTAGIPLFGLHLLNRLEREGHLRYNPARAGWHWDLGVIRALAYSDNVVDLMLDAMKTQLSAAALGMLEYAACIGYQVDVSLLARFGPEKTERAVRGTLRDALQAGFVELVDRTVLRFAHDRIQQAVYAMIPREKRSAMHLDIARQLLGTVEQDGQAQPNERVFELADQFNLGSESIADDAERRRLVMVNLQAGIRARHASAHASAARYLELGLRQLRTRDFGQDYRGAYSLCFELASCRYLLGQTAAAKDLLEFLLKHSQGLGDRARALHLKIELLWAMEESDAALAALQECTSLFGLNLPADPGPEEAQAEEAKFWSFAGKGPLDALAAAPARTEEDAHEFLLDSLLIATPLAHIRSPHLFHLVTAHAANIGTRHGSAGERALAYALLGSVCCTRDDIDAAARLERLALQLLERPDPPVPARYRAPALLVIGSMLGPYSRPLRSTLDDLQAAFDYGKSSDEPVAANLACEYIAEQRCAGGAPCADVLQDVEARLDFVKRTPYRLSRPVLEAWLAFLRHLRAPPGIRPSFDSGTFSERDFERQLSHSFLSSAHVVYYSLKLQARYLAGDLAAALEAADQALRCYRFALSSFLRADFHFYRALAAAAFCRALDPASPGWLRHHALVKEDQARLALWARYCPANFAARTHLVQAELARVEDDAQATIGPYILAIEAAHAQGAVHLSALAHELAAGFCRDHGHVRLADTLAAGALAEYGRWGATGKAARMRQRYPGLAGPGPEMPGQDAPHEREQLDLLALSKAAQGIANEVTTGRLHETLLRTLLAHVGADSAQLLLCGRNGLALEESALFRDEHFHLQPRGGLAPAPDLLPVSIVQYVARAKLPLVLDDACARSAFAHDPYLRGKRQCAVLCMPILRQQALVGVLYLENAALPGAFARVNLEVLEWLLVQVAISIENAGLYEELQESAARLAAVMEYAPANVYMKDAQARYLFVNREFERTFGIAADAILHKTDFDLFPDAPELAESIRRTDLIAMREGTISIEEKLPTADGLEHILLSVKSPLYRNGEVNGLCGISLDISEQKRARERIDYLAHYDVLTGLPNRHLLGDRLEQAIAEARRTGSEVGLLVLDLDRFKIINDSLGHRAGDLLLCEVAARLKAGMRDGDTVARLGGDEFAVIAHTPGGGEAVRQIASKLVDSLSAPFQLDGHRITTGACVGISLFPQDAQSGDLLLQYADLAMYQAKQHGRKVLQFYNEAMDLRAQERMQLENELRNALANDELFLLYQPQVNLRDHHVTGAEVLVRWRHPARGVISPALFIPLAEECGLISEITQWEIDQACAQLRAWKEAGFADMSLAVNVSALNVQHDDLYHSIERALASTGISGGSLELEMTEGTLMKDMDESIRKLVELKQLGVRVSIDDFGTGYSSLSYLKQLPVDKLKIDQSFVRDIARDPDDAAITGAIIAMGKQLNLKVIAEGVEDADAERFLIRHRCDQMQGYLFSPPVTADALTRMLS